MKNRVLLLLVVWLLSLLSLSIFAQTSEVPGLVNIPGTIQSALGCDGDWAPDCDVTPLGYDEANDVFIRSFDVPQGNYEYKVALDGTWGENYGAFADQDGPNIVLTVPEDMTVTFAYDYRTNWIMDTVRQEIVTAPGTYQTALGCAQDWQVDCMKSWLQDIDGDGIYSFSTDAIPAGDYEVRVALNWIENADADLIQFSVDEDGTDVTFLYDSNMRTLVVNTGGGGISGGSITELTAYWVSADTLLWDVEVDENLEYALLSSSSANMSASIFGLTGDYDTYPLTIQTDDIDPAITNKFPHLAGLPAFSLDLDMSTLDGLLRGQTVIATLRGGEITALAGLQIAGILDDLYTTDAPLGITVDDDIWTLSVWAPTAQNVHLNLFPDADPQSEPEVIAMQRADDGIWSVTGDAAWDGLYYTYTVSVYVPSEGAIVDNEVTDPYSIGLSQNSLRSLIVNLDSETTKPESWDMLVKPHFGDNPENISVYELHLRDFSAFDETVPEDWRGTYLAFTVDDSDGMNHLRALAEAGLTHLHLLPTFDIATINENRRRTLAFTPDPEELAGFDPTSEEQQDLIDEVRDLDAFNWGYDPFHFMSPEGSYSTDPNGITRILEYRQMVEAVNQAGLRFVQDVVFNHTNASGQNNRSVLDRVVPGYYHRLNESGRVHTSTCCQNTATEHNMMRRLMIDTIVLNAIHYKVDGFRFDLMGHHMLDDMLAVRAALDAITMEEHGIDGEAIYLYGEGWNFGEVANNARGFHATQVNAAGTGIGTFNDRLRDAVRGGNPFGDRDKQGLGNGVFTFPNGLAPENEDRDRALLFADQTRIGLAGNLLAYTFIDRNDNLVTGADVSYGGSPTGYTLDPQENVIYVSKHDNETLFDNTVYRVPPDTSIEDITRIQLLSLSYPMYSQGIPFFHAGSDILRSKSMDRDSYNSGDWFNRIDWTYQSNNFRVGMPMRGVNESQYDIIHPVLENEAFLPGPEHIAFTRDVFRDMLGIRYSSPLFRLETAEQIQANLSYLNTGSDQLEGVIIMSLDDTTDIDPTFSQILVVFNGQNQAIEFEAMPEMSLDLHPIQAEGSDDLVKGASYDNSSGVIEVPALTTAVFVSTD